MHYDYTADFETTTDENDCRVWAFAVATIEDEPKITYGTNIQQFFDWISELNYNPKIYFHNLKFDGEYILHYLLSHGFEWKPDRKSCTDFTFNTLIMGTGLFYKIEVYFKKQGHKVKKVTFLDSLKILNFSVDQIAKDFKLPIQKLKIDYDEYRAPNHELTAEEIAYIRNDVGIMARALNITFKNGLTKMTIGSNALSEYKDTQPKFRKLFPVLDPVTDKDIRRSYRGGWTYLNPDYAGKMIGSGCVIDKNSMYPSQMYFENLPIGYPIAFDGKYEEDLLHPLYVQSFSCIFQIKENRLPSIQIKSGFSFRPNEWLTSSNGELVHLTLTNLDLDLFLKNYDVENLVWHGGWKMRSAGNLFVDYIDHWTEEKINAKKAGNNANYILSKLLLNSLYGKFGTNPISVQKAPELVDDVIKYHIQNPEIREPVYIPMAAFITSYARTNIISTAQKIVDYSLEKYGKNLFVYSDTDSIHCLLSKSELESMKDDLDLDPYRLGAWDVESEFDQAKFLRQKCYIEKIGGELNVHIAGLPRKLAKYMTFENFHEGFTTDDLPEEVRRGNEKLTYKHVKGGVILKPTDFTIKRGK